MPIDLLDQQKEEQERDKPIDLLDQQMTDRRMAIAAMMDYNKDNGNEARATAINSLYFNPMDGGGNAYFGTDGATPNPMQRTEELKKVVQPSDADVPDMAEVIANGGSVIQNVEDEAQTIADKPQEERGVLQKVWDAWETGYWDDKQVEYYKRMNKDFYPDIGEEMLKGQMATETKRRQFVMKTGIDITLTDLNPNIGLTLDMIGIDTDINVSTSGMIPKAYQRGMQGVKRGMVGAMNVSALDLLNAPFLAKDYVSEQVSKYTGIELLKFNPVVHGGTKLGLDKLSFGALNPSVQKRLEYDISSWMKAAEVPKSFREDWAANQGKLWWRPDFWANFILESGPTMTLNMMLGGQAASALTGMASVFGYGATSAIAEAASESGGAMIEAREKGGTEEQIRKVGSQVFKHNVVLNTVQNSFAFGTGKMSRMIKNPLWKGALVGTAMASEGEVELRQDEFVKEAIATIITHESVNIDPFYYPRWFKGLMNKETRDVTIMSTLMGALEPIQGKLQDMRQQALEGKVKAAVLDMIENYGKSKLAEMVKNFEKKEELNTFDAERYDIIKNQGEKNLETVINELEMVDAKEDDVKYDEETMSGIQEDSSIGKEKKAEISSIPDPTERATPELINKVIEKMEDIGLRKADAEKIREIYNLKKLSKAEAVAWEAALSNAQIQGMEKEALSIAERVLADPANNLITMTQHAAFVLREAQLQNEFDSLQKEIRQLREDGNNDLAKSKQKTSDSILGEIDTITRASIEGGSAMARAFNFRKIRINRETFSKEAMVQQAENMKGKKLTEKEEKVFDDLNKVIEEKNKLIKDLEAQLEEERNQADGEEFIDETAAHLKKSKKKRSKKAIQSRIDAAKERIRAAGHRAFSGIDPTLAMDIAVIAEGHIEQGIKKLPELMKLLEKELPDFSTQDILDAFSGKSKKKVAKTLDGVGKLVKELKKQARVQSDIIDGFEGIFAPDTTGEAMSAEVLNLGNKLQELKNLNAEMLGDVKAKEIQGKIDHVKDLIKRQHRDIKKTKTINSAQVQELQQALTDVTESMNMTDEIQRIESLGVLPVTDAGTPKGQTNAQLKARLAELTQWENKWQELENAKKKIFTDPVIKAPTPKGLDNLTNAIQALKNQYASVEKNRQKVNDLAQRLNEVQDFLVNQHRKIKNKQPVNSDEVALAQQKLNEAISLMNTIDKIQELSEAMEVYKEGDPEVEFGTHNVGDLKNPTQLANMMTPEARKSVLSEQLKKAKLELFQARRHAKVKIGELDPLTLGKGIEILGGTMMAATLSLDLGAVLRQGKMTVTGHPFLSAQTLAKVLNMQKTGIYNKKAMQDMFDEFMKAMYDHDHYTDWAKHKLALTDPIEGITKKEEGFTSANLIEKIPYYGTNLIKASENAHIMYLNTIRIALYEDFVSKLPSNLDPVRADEVKTAYAAYINSATGRGTLPGQFEKSAQTLTRIFLAPRWAWSNFQMAGLTPQNWKLYYNNPEMRKQMIKDYTAFITARVAFLAIGAAGGGEVSLNPESPDFLKLKIGDTRIDPWGGMIQPARLILGMAWIAKQQWTGERKKRATDKLMKQLARYMFYKTNPLVGFGTGFITREDVIGNQIEWYDNWKYFTPIIIQSSIDISNDQGFSGWLWGVPAEFFGLNVSAYPDRNKKPQFFGY